MLTVEIRGMRKRGLKDSCRVFFLSNENAGVILSTLGMTATRADGWQMKKMLSLRHLPDIRWSVGKAVGIQACSSGERSGCRERRLGIINL